MADPRETKTDHPLSITDSYRKKQYELLKEAKKNIRGKEASSTASLERAKEEVGEHNDILEEKAELVSYTKLGFGNDYSLFS